MADLAIETSQLYKVYHSKKGTDKCALDHVDLAVPRGSFFGLLGPNGAGKSTLINILAGLVIKTSGSASICGYDIISEAAAARKSIGIVPQELVLDPFFPVREALEFTAGYYGIAKKQRRTDEIIEAVGLTEKASAPARSLSGGMRRRLLIAKALVHSPQVLVLDEPTAGVDVELRDQLWSYVKQLNKQGTTILLTTHYLEEAEELCDEIAIINHGKIIARDTKHKLLKVIDHKRLLITTTEPVETLPAPLEKLGACIADDGRIDINYKSSETTIDEILGVFRKTNLSIRDLSTEEADLEEVFKHLTKAA